MDDINNNSVAWQGYEYKVLISSCRRSKGEEYGDPSLSEWVLSIVSSCKLL